MSVINLVSEEPAALHHHLAAPPYPRSLTNKYEQLAAMLLAPNAPEDHRPQMLAVHRQLSRLRITTCAWSCACSSRPRSSELIRRRVRAGGIRLGPTEIDGGAPC